MSAFNEIGKSFTDTIRTSDLKDVIIDFSENVVDTFLKDGFINDLPIIGAIIGIGKTALGIKDVLFLKKVLSFLTEINAVEPAIRQRVIDKIDSSAKYKMKVGEKLIYALDKCEDHISAKYVAQFFKALLEDKISYDEFLRGTRIIQNIFISDLEYFLDADINEFEVTGSSEEYPHEEQFPLINVGICGFGYDKVQLQPRSMYQREHTVEGGDAVIWVTSIGKKIKELLIREV